MNTTTLRLMPAVALIAAAASLFLPCSPAAAATRTQSGADAVAIGQRHILHSRQLDEDREVLVHLPAGYDASKRRYPVLYLLDGDAHFVYAAGIVDYLARNDRIPPMILVAVPNMQRRGRDLTMPVTQDKEELKESAEEPWRPTGGAAAFLGFLADELAPWVEGHYRTAPYRILSGHSLGGLFDFYALLERPDAFQAHIAVSPSLWWDQRAWVAAAKEKLGGLPGEHAVYFSWSDDESDIRDSSQELVDWLRDNPPPRLQWKSAYYPGDNHGTTPLRTLYDGLSWLYADWELHPPKPEATDYAALQGAVLEHYAALSRKYGYTIEPDPQAGYVLAGWLEKKERHEEALAVTHEYAAKYPEAGHLSVKESELLEKLGRPREALQALRQGLRFPGEYENVWENQHRLKELEAKAGK